MLLTIIKEWIPLIVIGFNVAMFIVIKFNDMKHIEAAVARIEKSVADMEKILCKTGERVATIEGKCKAMHG